MNVRQARDILLAYRASGEDDHEREVRAALRAVAKNPAYQAQLENQIAFDHAVADRWEDAPLPAELAGVLEEGAREVESRRRRRFRFTDPAVLAAALACLIVVGLLAWIGLGQAGSFAGMQEIAELVAEGDKAGPGQFTELETKAGALPDWFMMKNFDGFEVPEGFEDEPVVGVRTTVYEDVPVAVAAIAEPRAFFYVLEAKPLGLSLPPGEWKVLTYGKNQDRAFAVQQVGAMAFVIATRSGEAALRKYLDSRRDAR